MRYCYLKMIFIWDETILMMGSLIVFENARWNLKNFFEERKKKSIWQSNFALNYWLEEFCEKCPSKIPFNIFPFKGLNLILPPNTTLAKCTKKRNDNKRNDRYGYKKQRIRTFYTDRSISNFIFFCVTMLLASNNDNFNFLRKTIKRSNISPIKIATFIIKCH